MFNNIKIVRTCFVVAAILTLSACMVTNINRGTASNLVDYLYPQGQSVDHSADAIPHLKLPLRVGVAFVPESGSYFRSSLTEASKQQLLEKVAAKFNGRNYIESITIIPEIYLKQGKGFNALERIAAMHNVDVMAMVSYDQVVKSHDNEASFAYLTIVGAFIVPGTTQQSSTFVDTAVFDIATHKLLFRAPGYSEKKVYRNAIGAEASAENLARTQFEVAMDNMVVNLDKELTKFRERAKQGETVKVSYKQGYGGGSLGIWGALLLVMMLVFSRRVNR